MSSFTTPLILEALDDGCYFKVKETFTYEIGELGSGRMIVVPEGFVTDFASVPRIFWNIFPPWGRYGKAAVLHDWLYHRQEFSRMFSDSIFREAMDALNVGFVTFTVIYLAVRLGGFKAWNDHRRKKELLAKSDAQPPLPPTSLSR